MYKTITTKHSSYYYLCATYLCATVPLFFCRFFIICCLVFSSVSHASFARYSPQQLIATSDIIFSGRYIGKKILQLDGQPLHLSIIAVDQIIKGPDTEFVFIVASNSLLINSDKQKLDKMSEGIWFLPLETNIGLTPVYQFKHPQRLMPFEEANKLLQTYFSNHHAQP